MVGITINAVRGVPLNQRKTSVEERMQRLESKTDLITQKLRNTWNTALNMPIDVEAKWIHGDLHPRNILVENGAITGIIDWGDITSGDTATDIASIWMLFGGSHTRHQAVVEYGSVSSETLHSHSNFYFFSVAIYPGLDEFHQNYSFSLNIPE